MFTRALAFVLVVGLALVGLGCSEGAFAFNYYDDDPPVRVVHVEAAHVCTPACAHYYDEGRYVVVRRGHHHGPGCGHVFDGRRWVVVVVAAPTHVQVERHPAPAARVHPAPVRVVEVAPCPGPLNFYVFDRRGSKWLKVAKGHTHGPGCGHVYVETRWSMP